MDIIIETQRVKLRKFEKSDLDDFVKLAINPQYSRYLPSKNVTNEEAKGYFDNIIGSLEKPESQFYHYWAVVDKISKGFVGYTGNYSMEFNNENINMFLIALQHKYWAPFFSSQVAYLSCTQAFKEQNISELIAFIHPEDKGGKGWVELIGGKLLKETSVYDYPAVMWSISKETIIDPLH